MLTLAGVHAYYGKSHVLHGVGFEVGKGEIVALLGRKGSGRPTTAKAIMGMVECTGSVERNVERTVREQARSLYRKSGLTGRADLAAFFLEDLLPARD